MYIEMENVIKKKKKKKKELDQFRMLNALKFLLLLAKGN